MTYAETQWHLHSALGVEDRSWYCAARKGHPALLAKTEGREQA